MKQLPVVPIGDASDEWLLPVQNAIINTNGVFAISGLHGDLTWDQACKVGKKILKTYMNATQHNPYELHPGLDLHEGAERSTSHLRKHTTGGDLEDHVDQGLFNIVIGVRHHTFEDQEEQQQAHHDDPGLLQGLEFQDRGGEYRSVLENLIQASHHTVLAIVIPGYTLQVFESDISAARHRVRSEARTRRIQVFQCRLQPTYKVNGEEIGKILSGSVKGLATTVTVRNPFFGSIFHWEVASLDVTVKALKEVYYLAEGINHECSFMFFHRIMRDGKLLSDYAMPGEEMTISSHLTRHRY